MKLEEVSQPKPPITLTFTTHDLEPQGFFQRLFGLPVKKNALIELTNALARSNDLKKVTLDTVAQLNGKYRTDIHRKFAPDLVQLYRQHLAECLQDRKLSEREIEDTWHLKRLFGITDAEHEKLYGEAALDTYKHSLAEVVQHHHIC